MADLTDAAANATAGSALRELAGPLFQALERSGMPMLLADARQHDLPILFINAAFTAMTGYSAAEAIGQNCRFLQGADTDPATAAKIAGDLEAGRECNAELLNYRKDGTPFWNSLFIVPLLSADGRVAFFLSTQMDVTVAREAGTVQAALAHSQQRLADIQQRLQAALALSTGAVGWEWHIAEHRISGDARFAALYGMAPQDAATGIAPAAFFAMIHPLDRTRIRLALGGMMRGAEIFAKEFRMLMPDGTIRWVDGRGRAHYDDDDKPVRLIGTFTDITDQKRAEERLRIAQTAGGIGTFEYVQGFGTVSVSPQFCHLLGLQAAHDLPVRTINAVVNSSDAPIIEYFPDLSIQPGSSRQVEFRITRPDNGETRWLTRRGEYLRDAETSGLRFSGVIYDITQAKRTEQQLRNFTDTLENQVAERTRERDMVWRTSQDLFVICGFDFVCHSANPAWAKSLGYSASDLAGQSFNRFVHPDDLEQTAAYQARLAGSANDQAATGDFDLRMRAADGSTRFYSWHCVPEGDRFTASGRDITDRKSLEEQLRQSQKMEAVGQLTGGLAHDFNNLLTGIAGSLELLQTRIAQGRLQDLERYITAAQGASRRAAALTHRLLAFSRQQTLDPKPTDVNQLVMGMEELIRRTVGPAIEVVVSGAPALWTAHVDQNQLENALLNLCINARDAMPDGGRLTIETDNHALDEAEARARDLPPGEYLSLCVIDTGTGMTPEVIARAFDPFFTTKPLGQGTGLGLSMIYGFVRQSGGQVRIDSTAGDGTVMCLYLPRHRESQAVPEPAASISEARRTGQGETVLVVDDEPTVRMLVIEILQSLGYVAIEADDAPSGLRLLQSSRRIDMLVTDVGLPGGMNGRQVADIGRAVRPDLKILFITGYAEKSVLGPGDLTAGMRVLTKPFSIESLTMEIQALLPG
jgi:PAS domain S-box-containing protein